MIDSLIVFSQNGFTYIRKHPQLLMTIVLIIIVPAGFLMSGQQFLVTARESQERLEREQMSLLHDALAVQIMSQQTAKDHLAEEVVAISERNTDIVSFTIVHEERGLLQTVASLNPDEIGQRVGTQMLYSVAHIAPGETITEYRVVNNDRHLEGVRMVSGADGGTYYLRTEVSLARLDALFARHVKEAYYWLAIILGVVLVLMIRHIRLIDYAYLYRETKKANEMKDLFTNMIAHELRAPLTAIRGYASLVRESPETSSDTQKHITAIDQSAERLLLIVNDLLDVARIHAGKLSVREERVSATSVIQGVVESLKSIADEKHISLEVEHTHEIYVRADGKRLFQAFTNIINNALKYTQSGSIRISLDERSDRVEIRVKDSGTGIRAEDQKNLFAPFFRVENADTEHTLGSGLGMWITKQFIELMQGSIAVESIRGVGTHVVITLRK